VIVEFIGCAGAGKSTLRRLVCELGIPDRSAVAMADLVVGRPGLRWVTHPTAANVSMEIASFPHLVRTWNRERRLFSFSREALASSGVSTLAKLNGLRGMARKVGMYHLAQQRARDSVVLSDEGTLLAAYNLFVRARQPFDPGEVDDFLALVPLPERVVYVQASLATLVERAWTRPDPRRQHLGRTLQEVESDIRQTVELFDCIAESERLQGRVLPISNDAADALVLRERASLIAEWLETAVASERSAGRAHLLATARGEHG
jgi:hypothetical protein